MQIYNNNINVQQRSNWIAHKTKYKKVLELSSMIRDIVWIY